MELIQKNDSVPPGAAQAARDGNGGDSDGKRGMSGCGAQIRRFGLEDCARRAARS